MPLDHLNAEPRNAVKVVVLAGFVVVTVLGETLCGEEDPIDSNRIRRSANVKPGRFCLRVQTLANIGQRVRGVNRRLRMIAARIDKDPGRPRAYSAAAFGAPSPPITRPDSATSLFHAPSASAASVIRSLSTR